MFWELDLKIWISICFHFRSVSISTIWDYIAHKIQLSITLIMKTILIQWLFTLIKPQKICIKHNTMFFILWENDGKCHHMVFAFRMFSKTPFCILCIDIFEDKESKHVVFVLLLWFSCKPLFFIFELSPVFSDLYSSALNDPQLYNIYVCIPLFLETDSFTVYRRVLIFVFSEFHHRICPSVSWCV